jgi:hypothetical protein
MAAGTIVLAILLPIFIITTIVFIVLWRRDMVKSVPVTPIRVLDGRWLAGVAHVTMYDGFGTYNPPLRRPGFSYVVSGASIYTFTFQDDTVVYTATLSSDKNTLRFTQNNTVWTRMTS